MICFNTVVLMFLLALVATKRIVCKSSMPYQIMTALWAVTNYTNGAQCCGVCANVPPSLPAELLRPIGNQAELLP